MNKLEKALKARALLKECGEYDTSIAGAIGEIYAEDVLGMVKANRGESGYDGTINGRRVQVKGKEPFAKDEKRYYVAISHKNIGKAQDLVVVLLGVHGVEGHIGSVPIEKLKDIGATTKTQIRYNISKIKTLFPMARFMF